MNGWKRALICAVRKNGGYSSTRWERHALSFNVKLHYVDSDIESVIEKLGEGGDHPASHAQRAREYVAAKRIVWDANRQWEWAVEDARLGWNDGDCCKYLHPDVAKRHCLPDDMHFDVEFSQTGRSGGHIVIDKFEGRKLDISADSLIDLITGDDTAYNLTSAWCQHLLAFIAECDLMFNPTVASNEVMYQMAYRLASEVDDLIEEDEAAAEEAEQVRYWHERDVVTA